MPTPEQLSKVEVLKLLNKITPLTSIMEDLVIGRVFNQSDAIAVATSSNPAETMMIMIERAKTSGKIQLAHYAWTLLPKVYAQLQIVSDSDVHTWEYRNE